MAYIIWHLEDSASWMCLIDMYLFDSIYQILCVIGNQKVSECPVYFFLKKQTHKIKHQVITY